MILSVFLPRTCPRDQRVVWVKKVFLLTGLVVGVPLGTIPVVQTVSTFLFGIFNVGYSKPPPHPPWVFCEPNSSGHFFFTGFGWDFSHKMEWDWNVVAEPLCVLSFFRSLQ